MIWRSGTPDESAIVLYADDDENDLFFVRRAFAHRRPDVQLRTVVNGQEAMDYLSTSLDNRGGNTLPRLVILDLKMPFPDGFEVLHWVRSHPHLGDLPVVILSSSDRPSDQQKAADLGATHYVVKNSAFMELPDYLAPWLPAVSGERCPDTEAAARLPGFHAPAGAH